MLIWIALLLPVITTLVLYHFWKHEVVIWEFVIPFVVSLILVGICHLIIQKNLAKDTEYWGGIVTKAEYYERWNERVPCSHPEYCTRTTTDYNGNSTTETYQCGTVHLYDVAEHPPYWQVRNTNNEVIRISRSHYQRLVSKFGNSRFVDLRRNYHTRDGDKYESRWDRSSELAEITTTAHSYENRVKPSRSVFNYEEVDEFEIAENNLFRYPEISRSYHMPVIMGIEDREAEREFQLLNGYLGRKKQVRIWVLIFENQPRETGHLQEALWVGGNKNEFVITIGLEDDQVQWSYVFSWSEKDLLKIDTRTFIEEMEILDLVALANWLGPEINQRYERKEFEDFSYLKVEPPGWAILLVFLLVVLSNIGVSYFVINNEYRDRYARK